MKAIPSFLLLFSVISLTPNAVAQSVRSDDFNSLSTTSSQDLMGVEPRQRTDEDWAVGGQYRAASIEPERYDSNSLNLDLYQIKVDKLNRTYELHDRQLGDTQRPTSRFPFAEF